MLCFVWYAFLDCSLSDFSTTFFNVTRFEWIHYPFSQPFSNFCFCLANWTLVKDILLSVILITKSSNKRFDRLGSVLFFFQCQIWDFVYATFDKLMYTLGKKGCYTPTEDNKTNVDRTFVFPLGWNWHDMDPWLFPNEIRHYLGQTFNARWSGIVKLRNHSIGGRSPKSIFTLWQLWINICIFFQKFFWLFEQCPVQPLWVLGMRCLHLPVRALSKVLLLPVWVWLVLPSTAYSKGMLPLDLWCQASLQGLPERQHLG